MTAPGFTLDAVCAAPAIEVFKILHDPSRIPEWWDDVERVEAGPDGTVTRYTREWPDFAYPTAVAQPVPTGRDDGQVAAGTVRISCLLSDIVHEWTLSPHPDGCEVRVRVELPEREAGRIDAQRREVAGSLAGLVALAERSVMDG
ncbi:MAG TPA: SRPBCC family protein [Miltoncostaea sp.]|nr:SRPBCC family protein [Miltoncostaea sp.]